MPVPTKGSKTMPDFNPDTFIHFSTSDSGNTAVCVYLSVRVCVLVCLDVYVCVCVSLCRCMRVCMSMVVHVFICI